MADPTKLAWVQWLLLVIQVATFIVVAIYVWKTWEMASATRKAAEATARSVEESRLTRREASDPRVAIFFASPASSVAEIVIENYGETTATSVTFDFTPDLQASEHRGRASAGTACEIADDVNRSRLGC